MAKRLERECISIELNPAYIAMVETRIRTDDLSRAAIQLITLGYLLEQIKQNVKEVTGQGDGE